MRTNSGFLSIVCFFIMLLLPCVNVLKHIHIGRALSFLSLSKSIGIYEIHYDIVIMQESSLIRQNVGYGNKIPGGGELLCTYRHGTGVDSEILKIQVCPKNTFGRGVDGGCDF